MAKNNFVDYLNSLHNYNAQNENVYGESNVNSPYYKNVNVEMGLSDYIKDKLITGEPQVIILTGHAGDGKTSILYQVAEKLNAQIDTQKKKNEINLPNGNKCMCIKDFSELSDEVKVETMKEFYNILDDGNFVFMVANTGPLINTFGELASEEEAEEAKIALINAMDQNAGNIVNILGLKISVINIATIDNTCFATAFLEKLLQDELWKPCEDCSKKDYCHILKNRNLILENKTKTFDFINNHFVWLTEYGKRLTVRSMTEQLAFMITGGENCDSVKNYGNDAYQLLYSNFFFGYQGINLEPLMLNITAVNIANQCRYDQKRLRSDEMLNVDKEYRKIFGENVATIIENGAIMDSLQPGWPEFLRRAYFFTNIITENEVNDMDYEDIFSKQFKRFQNIRNGNDEPDKIDRNLIADALSMIYIGTPCSPDEIIPLTLSRESGLNQNVQLIIGKLYKREIRVISEQTQEAKFNNGIERYKIYLKIDNQKIDTELSLPMMNYFEELKNGVIDTNIDPQLSHGVESLKAEISKIVWDDEDSINMVILKNDRNKEVHLEFTKDGKIREV